MAEHWDTTDEDVSIGTCDHCGTENIPVRRTDDPFTREVNPEEENEESDWCRSCWTARKEDI